MSDFSSKGKGTATTSSWMRNVPAIVKATVGGVQYKEVGNNKTKQLLLTIVDETGAKAEMTLWAKKGEENFSDRVYQELNRMGDKLTGNMASVESIVASTGEQYAAGLLAALEGKPGYWIVIGEAQYIKEKDNPELVSRWVKPTVYPFSPVYNLEELADAEGRLAALKPEEQIKDSGIPEGTELKQDGQDTLSDEEGASPSDNW